MRSPCGANDAKMPISIRNYYVISMQDFSLRPRKHRRRLAAQLFGLASSANAVRVFVVGGEIWCWLGLTLTAELLVGSCGAVEVSVVGGLLSD